MQDAPRRLGVKRFPLLAHMPDGTVAGDFLPPATGRRLTRKLRAVRRFATVAVFTLLAGPVQAVLLLLPGRGKVKFARWYWRATCALVGMRVRSIGMPAGADGRPVIFVANHSSWLDIVVLGGRLEGCFVSKTEIGSWPIINVVAWLGRTVFVVRRRTAIGRERDAMVERLRHGDNLILFPEGTSSDGCRVLPFRSAFLSVAERQLTPGGQTALVQPVSVVYDRLAYLPTGRSTRSVFAWYGDMSLARHAWRLAQYRGLRATVLLHVPLEPSAFADRKALTRAAWATVADGAATLRQNRPARPLAPDMSPNPGSMGQPALA
jgi:1-acyl-sn-glycerol-3-phosphate acyltransferase